MASSRHVALLIISSGTPMQIEGHKGTQSEGRIIEGVPRDSTDVSRVNPERKQDVGGCQRR